MNRKNSKQKKHGQTLKIPDILDMFLFFLVENSGLRISGHIGGGREWTQKWSTVRRRWCRWCASASFARRKAPKSKDLHGKTMESMNIRERSWKYDPTNSSCFQMFFSPIFKYLTTQTNPACDWNQDRFCHVLSHGFSSKSCGSVLLKCFCQVFWTLNNKEFSLRKKSSVSCVRTSGMTWMTWMTWAYKFEVQGCGQWCLKTVRCASGCLISNLVKKISLVQHIVPLHKKNMRCAKDW